VNLSNLLGLGFVVIFLLLMITYASLARKRPKGSWREITAFSRLGRSIGLAVEAGKRLHISLGHGSLNGLQAGSAFMGLSVLQRIARVASISDSPPIATSGEGVLGILSQDTQKSTYRAIGSANLYEPGSGQITGLTPFSFAAGTLPVIFDQNVAANVLAGHFGSEVALITEAGERNGSLTLAGSDNLTAQAVLYAAAQEPLIGEELYASGAYIQAGNMHSASLRTQDFMRWVIILAILVGAVLKLVNVL
jgi:hypothetical protein